MKAAMPPPVASAASRRRVSRGWLLTWLAGLTIIGLTFLVAGALVIANQPHRFIIEAHTEYLEVPSAVIRLGDTWDVGHAEICEQLFSVVDGFETRCEVPQFDDLVLIIPNGSSLSFQRLDWVTPQQNVAKVDSSNDAAADASGAAVPFRDAERRTSSPLEVAVRPVAGELILVRERGAPGPPRRSYSNTVILRWSEPPLSPLDFRGLASVGQLPEGGVRGVLIEGRASAHMAARAGAPRFAIAGAELVAGDVARFAMPEALPWRVRLLCAFGRGTTPACTTPGAADNWGFVRYSSDIRTGFDVVYSGPAEAVVVDRLGARFALRPGWTDRLQLDPLAQLLYSGATLAVGVLTVLLSLNAGRIIDWFRHTFGRGDGGAVRAEGKGAGAETPPELEDTAIQSEAEHR